MAEKRGRPLSPHLQVYRPQLTSILSILHRATGFALAVGTLFLAWWLIAAAMGPDAYATVESFYASWLGYLVLLGFSFSLMYHLCNGIRHLAWDAGWGFDLPTAYASGWAVLAGSVILTVLAWGVGLLVVGQP
jgi:succinate dehydrogenase / fumarate reductase cytochrome b subunit